MAVETLLITLGSTVVKAASRLWIGENELAGDLQANAIDMLASRLTGELDKRRLRRFFEQMMDDVAQRLRPMMEAEFSRLTDNEREASLLQAQQTLELAELDNRKLLDADLDSRLLYSVIKNTTVVPRAYLSADATELCELILRESCGYIIEISKGLPSFGNEALTTILRRETQIISDIREVLSRLPQRATSEFGYDYRQLVARVLDRIEVFGAPVHETSRSYPLSVAYLSLTADLIEQDSTRTFTAGWRIEDVLAGADRILVRGDAGLGKTTLLQWIAVRSAKRNFVGSLDGWNKTTPFYIPLRRYGDRAFPAPEDFLDEIGKNIAATMPPGWVQAELRLGNALVLIDGVDEVASHRRKEARDWLMELLASFPNSRYVITSRPAALSASWLHLPDFAVADLQPMSMADVRVFVTRWHTAIASMEAHDDLEVLNGYREDLLTAILYAEHLQKLAGFPLLAALLCAVNRDRRSALPSNRMELYELALDMLLERRDAERKLHPLVGLNKAEKILLLGDLSYWLLRNGHVDVPSEQATARLRHRLLTMPQIAADASDVYAHLLERSGLIREKVEGRVDFIHRSFQEYLAARAAVSEDDIGTLIEKSTIDAWHDVIVMAAGHAQRAQRDALIDGLLDAAAKSRNLSKISLLALACLETSPELDSGIRQRLESQVATLVPPQSVSVAGAFSAAGPFVLDLLANAELRTATEAAATVRALVTIGSAAALTALTKFSGEQRDVVLKELIAGWREFDRELYAKLLLRNVPIRSLVVRDVETSRAVHLLTGLKQLTAVVDASGDLAFVPASVSELTVSSPRSFNFWSLGTTHLKEISAIAETVSYRSPNYSTIDATGLAEFRALQSVRLSASTLTGIHHLAGLSRLRKLHLRGASSAWHPNQFAATLEDLSVAGSAENAASVAVGFGGRMDSLVSLSLQNLTLLSAGGLTASASLRNLRLRKVKLPPDLGFISRLTSLESLDLTDTIVGDLTLLAPLLNLKTLTISGPRDSRGLLPLRSFPSLRALRIRTGGTFELGALAGVRNLEILVEGPTVVKSAGSVHSSSSVHRARVNEQDDWVAMSNL